MNFKDVQVKGKEDKREICKYGADCYQKNPFHIAKYRHPKRSAENVLQNPTKKTKPSTSSSEPTADESIDKLEGTSDSGEKNISVMSSGHHTMSDSSGEENSSVDREVASSLTDLDTTVVSKLLGNDAEKLKQLYFVEFPEELYSFYDYCKSVYSKTPKTSLRDLGLELVGPFDYLSGEIISCSSDNIIRHYRYYFDPPEFYTVLKSTNSELHFGYFFDEPNKPPLFVASNDPSQNCSIQIVAPNIFGAVNSHISSLLKTCDPFKKAKIQKLQISLNKFAKEKKYSVELNTLSLRKRNSKVNSKTFHGAGIVVPYDKSTDVGYRPLAENDKTLKSLFFKITESETESERDVQWNKIEHVITYALIAADECDFGTPLELGLNMFCTGHSYFHKTAQRLMSVAYNLLGRNHFTKVIDIHLQNRIKGSNLNFAAAKK